MDEHPVAKHEFQLQDHEERISKLEEQMLDLLNFKAAMGEQSKTIFTVIGEIKILLEKYTTEMRQAMKDLGSNLNTRINKIEKDLEELKGRSGRKWDSVGQTVITVLISLVVGYIFAVITKGTP